jgi:hypothetical protein
MKKRVQTVNKHKPQVEFKLWASNNKGYCPVGNREIIGICNTRIVIKKALKLNAKQTEHAINFIQDTGKFLIFGRDIDPYFATKISKVPNAFFLGV